MMKTLQSRKVGRSKYRRKLGKISLDTETSVNYGFGDELNEIPGHFMYNEENDAIQQVLKLPDISVNDGTEHREGNKPDLSLPPISGDDKGSNEYRKHNSGQTKLPKIKAEPRNNSVTQSCWLERHDVSSISWKKALDVLDDKARDFAGKHHKRPKRDISDQGRKEIVKKS